MEKRLELMTEIVREMIEEHEGGEAFFDNLDSAVKQIPITEQLLSLVPEDIDCLIVSGGFGRFFRNYYSDKLLFYKVISVKGSLRKGETIDDLSTFGLQGLRVVFIDDSFYLGRTRDCVKKEIERCGADLIQTIVAYDGSLEKDVNVRSLYRYYDNH